MSSVTAVVFRVWNPRFGCGGCIALFPLSDEGQDLCSSYEHVGQHGLADYAAVISRTRPATPDDYASLKRELEGAPFGYVLQVYKRRPKP